MNACVYAHVCLRKPMCMSRSVCVRYSLNMRLCMFIIYKFNAQIITLKEKCTNKNGDVKAH